MPFLKNLLKNVDRPEIDFPSLRLKRKPNQFLMAPEGLCSVRIHAKSPVFALSHEELESRFTDLALSEENTEKLSSREIDATNRQVEFVQYSKRIGYPDTITMQFMARDDGTSTFAAYSRAHYGNTDFGVNARRILRWLSKLKPYIVEGT